jgi:tetratricopeptide (TPR) repeat protein
MRTCNLAPGGALALAVLLAPLVASLARAGDLEDGLRLAAEGRCSEALPLLDGELGPPARRALALCLVQTGDYAGAIAELARLEPADLSLTVDLGVARYHAGDRAGAAADLERAVARGDARADAQLYLGLIALERDDAAGAAGRFERARSLDPFASEPVASYYAGLAAQRRGRHEDARAALERVVAGAPHTPWAEEAKRALASLAAAPRAWFASLRVGFEHDTNAVLRGEGVELPAEIPSESDQRFTWRGVAGRSFQTGPGTQLGAALAFSGTAHLVLTDFDALHPALTLWADRALGERYTLRAIGSYAHAWVNADDFLSAPGLAVELHRNAGERGATRAFAEFAVDDFRFATPGTPAEVRARDRDGLGVRIGIDHRIAVERLATTFSGGLAYRRFTADGTEYSFDSPELELGFESQLPSEIVLAGGARYAYRPYRYDTTFESPPEQRTEHEWRTELALRRSLWRQLGVETRWRYQRNRSTADVFDFSRHVVGLYMSWTLSP